MKYSFDTRSRRHTIRSYRALTSPVVVAMMAVACLVSVVAWLLLVFVAVSAALLGLAFIAASLAAAALLALLFASTYYPYLPSPKTVQALKSDRPTAGGINAAQAASFSLLLLLSRYGLKQNKKNLRRATRRLAESPVCDFLLRRLEISRSKVIKIVEKSVLPELTWSDFSRRSLELAGTLEQPEISPEHALGCLLLHPRLERQLRASGLTRDDVLFTLWWGAERRYTRLQRRRWWDEERLLAFTGVGLSWASGYTPFVDRFARLPPGGLWDNIIYGHEDKVEELINTLARQRQSNVLLVGNPGVGRLGIVRWVAKRIRGGTAHPELMGQRLLYINIGELMAQGGTAAAQAAVVSRALREMERAGNIIAVIDGLSSVLGEYGEQRINLTDVLLPFLASANVRVLVMVSSDDYYLRLKSNQKLTQYFEVVVVPSLTERNTLKRLALSVPVIERRAGLYIPYRTIRTLVEETSSIMPHIPFPERAFDFLEEAIVAAQVKGSRVLTVEHIENIISRKIGLSLGRLKSKEKTRLLKLEELMHRRLVDQEAAVKAVARAMVRARAEVRSQERPIGAFLFLGPTGVGKTETAKTLAEVYFGSEEHMTRLDMSEFQGEDAVSRLIGSAEQPAGRLTSLIADHPFTVLLLDEFEKADRAAHQLFLQVLDEGRLSDARGRAYSFRHAIIIATSNAGAELIRREAKGGRVPDGFDQKLKEHILSRNILRPELLNRFDGVITYAVLSREHIRRIAVMMLRQLNRRLDEEHGVVLKITDALVDFLVEKGYDPQFGARPMNRTIQDYVEYAVAQKIIKGEAQPGQSIVLLPATLRGT